jgi:hypothetical protein
VSRTKRRRKVRRWKNAADWLLGREDKVKRVCIGCIKPFWQNGLEVNMMEQFCGESCKTSFFKGYDLGLRVNGQISKWPKMCSERSSDQDRQGRSMGGYARIVEG